jgi:hypothetical protein
MECRFCLDSGTDMISPCKCSGSVKYIHSDCLYRWVREEGVLIEERLNCSLCKSPLFPLEVIPDPHERPYTILYSPLLVMAIVQYIFISRGILSKPSGLNVIQNGQITIHLIYATLFWNYMTIRNFDIYMRLLIKRGVYIIWLTHLYCIYSFIFQQNMLMLLVSGMCIDLEWNQHVYILNRVNDFLLKN